MGELVEAKALARLATTEFESYVKLIKKLPPEVVGVVQQIEDHAKLADTISSHLALKIPGRQAILETTTPANRLNNVVGIFGRKLSVHQGEHRLHSRGDRESNSAQAGDF